MPNYEILRNYGSFSVALIPGKGRGLIANRMFSPGERFNVDSVLLIPSKQIKDNDVLANYIFQWYFDEFGNIDENNEDYAALALGINSLLNHSDTANCDWDFDPTTKLQIAYTTRVISVGEEMTWNYGWPEGQLEMSSVKLRTRRKTAYPVVAKDIKNDVLDILVSKSDKKLAEKIFTTYIGDEDWSRFPSFFHQLDDLILNFGGKPIPEDEESPEDKPSKDQTLEDDSENDLEDEVDLEDEDPEEVDLEDDSAEDESEDEYDEELASFIIESSGEEYAILLQKLKNIGS